MLACCMARADPLVRPQLEIISNVSETHKCFFTLQTPPPPAPTMDIQSQEVRTFTVVVPTKNFTTLGLQLEMTETRAPTVLGIEEGAIEEFNRIYVASSIRPFDVLLAVDGMQSWEAIQKKMASKLPDKMYLTFKRPREIQLVVETTGDMGMTLAYTEKSVGVVVQELKRSGLMAKWNAKRKSVDSDTLEVLDRIVGFDGKAYCGTELATLLEEKKIWRLTVLKYAQCEPLLDGLSRGSF